MTEETSPSIELRVLFGPQAGSRMSLAAGEYLLGCSDACDIILAGSRMQERHATLVIDADDDAVRLVPEDGSISDALGNEATDALVLTLGIPVELGGISIVVDQIDAPWPDARAVAPMPAAAPAPQPVDAQTRNAPQPQGYRRYLPPLQELQRLRQAWQRRTRGAVLACAGVVVAGALALVLLFASESDPAAAPPVGAASPAAAGYDMSEALAQALRSLDPGRNLAITQQDDKAWIVSGYVTTEAEKKAITDALALLSPVPLQKIHSDEAILRGAGEALNAREDSDDGILKVERIGKGRLRLAGAARRATTVQSARLALMVVPGVNDVEVSVLLPEQLLAQLKERIEAVGLGQRLVFAKEWPEVVVEGNVDAAERARWNEVLKSNSRAYGDVLPVRAKLGDTVQPAPFTVKAIVGGAAPYVVTQQGVRVNRGGSINGNKLVAVNDAEAVFDGAQRWQVGR